MSPFLLPPAHALTAAAEYFLGYFFNGEACNSDAIALFGKKTAVCTWDQARSSWKGAVFTKYECFAGMHMLRVVFLCLTCPCRLCGQHAVQFV